MRSLPKMMKKVYKPIAMGLAVILAVSIIGQVFSKNALTVEAKQDTLPGIEKLRNEFITTSETYRILEIQPNISAAEVGFYIGGQEPFQGLLDENNHWVTWQDKLASFRTSQERLAFMQSLVQDAGAVMNLLNAEGTGESPFSVTEYVEKPEALAVDEALAQGYSYFDIAASKVRGYFSIASDSSAGWRVIFEPLNNWNITLDEINNGIGTPYYKAIFDADAPLTREALEQMATGEDAAICIYLYDGNYLHYAGTAQEVWNQIKDTPTVSDGNASVSGGNASVSGNDISVTENKYYTTTFELINGNAANAVTAGSAVYVVNTRDVQYVKENGNYELVETEEGVHAGSVYDIPKETVYYKGGIDNAEVFRKSILGLDEEEWNQFDIQIDTMTPGMFNRLSEEEMKQYDMIYFGTGALRNNMLLLAGESSFTYTEDFSANSLEALAGYIYRNELPCIVDSSYLLKIGEYNYEYNVAWNGTLTNRQKLFGFLLASEKETAFTDENYNQLVNELKESSYTYVLGKYFPIDNVKGSDYSSAGTPRYDGEYVCENVWVYNSNNSFFIRNGFAEEEYSQTKRGGGFQAVLDEIKAENEIRKADISVDTYLSEEITDAAAWRYVLNYRNRRGELKKNSLTVLMIQPGTNSVDENFVSQLSAASGISTSNISVDSMAVTEFIGIIDDLNAKYDLIYIGNSTTGLNMGWNSETGENETVYYDTTMNGLLYSHVGDKITETANISGLLDTDYVKYTSGPNKGTIKGMASSTTHRYTGNDITVEKYNALLDYAAASYPIVVGDSLMTETAEGSGYVANGARVDNSSYLYELLNVLAKSDNFFRFSDVTNTNHKFTFYLNRPKLHLEGFQILNTEDYTNNPVVQVIQKSAVDDKYYLSFQFTIKNEGAVSVDTEYTCKLYLDSNADGKFSTKNEELSGLTITDSSGRRVDTNQLKAGVTYTVSRQIPAGYEGCITWKLVVQQRSNAYIRTDQIGYVRLQKDSSEAATTIRILQIYFHSTYNKNINLQSQLADSNSAFGRCAAAIRNEYALNITTIYRNDFQAFVTNRKSGYELGIGSNTDPADNDLKLSEFDMLIIGFSDAYDGTLSNDWQSESVEVIKNFANSGRSVLFSHDTTSVVNIPKELNMVYEVTDNNSTKVYYKNENGNGADFAEFYWGYYMNKEIRNLVGMDAFGITDPEGLVQLKTGVGLSSDNSWYNLNNGKIKADGRYEYNFKDLAYAPGSNRASTVPEVQGYTYPVLMTRNTGSNLKTYRSNIEFVSDYTNTVNKVTQVNEGQITNYPFKIDASNMSVASTHNQYYALDMNSDTDLDGQTDMVVWFCLTNSIYGGSHNDVRNNYYIYNKGNITYTGMGHSVNVDTEEAKLFINTMIASYQSGIKSPEVSVLDADGYNNYIYNFYDNSLTQDGKVEITFSLQDMNMTSGTKEMEVSYWIETGTGADGEEIMTEITAGIEGGSAEGFGTYYDSNTGDRVKVNDLTKMQQGVQYRVIIPAVYFKPKDATGNEIIFEVRSKTNIQSNGSEKESPEGIGQIHYLNCELLELD